MTTLIMPRPSVRARARGPHHPKRPRDARFRRCSTSSRRAAAGRGRRRTPATTAVCGSRRARWRRRATQNTGNSGSTNRGSDRSGRARRSAERDAAGSPAAYTSTGAGTGAASRATTPRRDADDQPVDQPVVRVEDAGSERLRASPSRASSAGTGIALPVRLRVERREPVAGATPQYARYARGPRAPRRAAASRGHGRAALRSSPRSNASTASAGARTTPTLRVSAASAPRARRPPHDPGARTRTRRRQQQEQRLAVRRQEEERRREHRQVTRRPPGDGSRARARVSAYSTTSAPRNAAFDTRAAARSGWPPQDTRRPGSRAGTGGRTPRSRRRSGSRRGDPQEPQRVLRSQAVNDVVPAGRAVGAASRARSTGIARRGTAPYGDRRQSTNKPTRTPTNTTRPVAGRRADAALSVVPVGHARRGRPSASARRRGGRPRSGSVVRRPADPGDDAPRSGSTVRTHDRDLERPERQPTDAASASPKNENRVTNTATSATSNATNSGRSGSASANHGSSHSPYCGE